MRLFDVLFRVAPYFCVILPSFAHAQTALADPRGSGPIVSAVQRLQGTLLGTVATVVAVIALGAGLIWPSNGWWRR